MFSIEQIMLAHSKVKTGGDFPQYAEEIKQLGVTYYETYVVDGHTDFFGANSYRITSPAKYPDQAISTECNTDAFKLDLMSHQRFWQIVASDNTLNRRRKRFCQQYNNPQADKEEQEACKKHRILNYYGFCFFFILILANGKKILPVSPGLGEQKE